MIKSLFSLEYANYYRESPRYRTIAIFSSVELAEKYLRSDVLLYRTKEKEELVPHPRCKNASLKFCKSDGYYHFNYNDDGVVSAFRLKKFNVIESEKDLPPRSVRTVCGNVETTYTFKNGKTVSRNKILKR